MKFPIIRVRNKGSRDKGIIVGADECHHYLEVANDGNLKFTNMQCCEGTGKNGGYEFVSDSEEKLIEFGSIWDILKLYGKSISVAKSSHKDEFVNAVLHLKAICENVSEENERQKQEMLEHLIKHIKGE